MRVKRVAYLAPEGAFRGALFLARGARRGARLLAARCIASHRFAQSEAAKAERASVLGTNGSGDGGESCGQKRRRRKALHRPSACGVWGYSDGCGSAPGGSRTPNPRFRRPMLYPVELRALNSVANILSAKSSFILWGIKPGAKPSRARHLQNTDRTSSRAISELKRTYPLSTGASRRSHAPSTLYPPIAFVRIFGTTRTLVPVFTNYPSSFLKDSFKCRASRQLL